MDSGYHGTASATPHTGERSRKQKAALLYANRGMPVFPCKPGGKEPLTCRGFKEATTDPRRIHLWWNRWPNANIGIPTGEHSGLLVLDVDPNDGGANSLEALVAEHGELPATTTVSTGGGGLHHHFRYPASEVIRNSAGKLGPGLDIRGEGGYVVVPPSHTEGPYKTLERLPLAVPPEWLLRLLRKPSSGHGEEARRGETPVSAVPNGGPIPEGQRNHELTRIAGRLHDGTRDLATLESNLLAINEAQCVPPLPEREVSKIARSIHRKEPCKQTSPEVGAEVLEALDSIETAHLWEREWKGARWKSPRSVMVSLIKLARQHGRLSEDGVLVSVSIRRLALLAALGSTATTQKAIDRLTEAGVIARADIERSGPKAGAFVLRFAPRAKLTHSPTRRAAVNATVSTLRGPLTAPRLRWSRPVFEAGIRVDTIRRLGKTAEAIVDILEKRPGWLPLMDLAEELGIKRPRDLRRRDGVLERLAAASVVECSGEAVRLCLDWLNALKRRREEDQEIADYERDRKRYDDQRRWYILRLEVMKLKNVGMDLDEIGRVLNVGIEDVRSILKLPDPAPTEGEMDARREAREAAGEVRELERVPDPEPALVTALREYLEHNPRRREERPSWLAVTLWAQELVEGKPSASEVEVALSCLGDRAA